MINSNRVITWEWWLRVLTDTHQACLLVEMVSMRLSMRACSWSAGACGAWLWVSTRANSRPALVTARAGHPWVVRLRHDQYTRSPRRLRAMYPHPSSSSEGAPRRVTVYRTASPAPAASHKNPAPRSYRSYTFMFIKWNTPIHVTLYSKPYFNYLTTSSWSQYFSNYSPT